MTPKHSKQKFDDSFKLPRLRKNNHLSSVIPSFADIFNSIQEDRTLNVEGSIILQLRKRLNGLLTVSLAQSLGYKGINIIHLWGNTD